MSETVTLLMAIHCHQPVGNFGFVFEEAYAKAYDPFLRVVERHPDVRLALHYSGCLLDWLAEHQPSFLNRLQRLVGRGQIELLASGYYEPILPLIPEADRQGQIAAMRHALRTHCHADAHGLWLTERVWEPDLPRTLARAGIRYTMIDVNQFASATPWLPTQLHVQDGAYWDLLGCYVAEYAGEIVTLFPASKRLRYWLPFQPVAQTMEFLGRLRAGRERLGSSPGEMAITFADDGEKFGFWPKTYRWVYEEGWLEQFFTALERERAWLTTSTFHDYLERAHPAGRVFLPSGSYEEMLEWSGGYFRNFFAKYPEANALYHKMLRVSHDLQEISNAELRMSKVPAHQSQSTSKSPSTFDIRNSKLLKEATQALYAGQCNCAYWHGVFGGLYLSHLRRAVYARLIAAEDLAHQASGTPVGMAARDVDGDGREEVCLHTPAMGLVVDPHEGGALTEWSVYPARLNLLDTLSRRPEPYHEQLRALPAHADAARRDGTPVSIHDLVGVKEPGLADRVIYDDHRRSAFLDYALERLPTLEEIVRATWTEQRVWAAEPFQRQPDGRLAERRASASSSVASPTSLALSMVRPAGRGRIRKIIRLMVHQPLLECRYELDDVEAPVVALEFNVALRDERYLHAAGHRAEADRFEISESPDTVSLAVSIDPPATLFHVPVETVSESEAGLERTYQGLCVICCWRRPPEAARGRWAATLRWNVEGLPSRPASVAAKARGGERHDRPAPQRWPLPRRSLLEQR